MTDALQQDEVARRLAGEPIGWLTTVSPGGQPQSSPVWFIWHGGSLWLRSQPGAGKVRNVEANPGVAFHLADDGQGGGIVTIEGRASLEDEGGDELLEAYRAKYEEAMRSALQTTPEQLAADYSTTIHITPTRARVW
jgi:PPOX class probable F420-dependent enzyme